MGELNSFESALFLKVDDTAGVLDKIRKTLLQTSQEVAALKLLSTYYIRSIP